MEWRVLRRKTVADEEGCDRKNSRACDCDAREARNRRCTCQRKNTSAAAKAIGGTVYRTNCREDGHGDVPDLVLLNFGEFRRRVKCDER
jgi:hypothetical protein